jgi:hypothetical protein
LARAAVADVGAVDGGGDVQEVTAVDLEAVKATDEIVAADVALLSENGAEVLHSAHVQSNTVNPVGTVERNKKKINIRSV